MLKKYSGFLWIVDLIVSDDVWIASNCEELLEEYQYMDNINGYTKLEKFSNPFKNVPASLLWAIIYLYFPLEGIFLYIPSILLDIYYFLKDPIDSLDSMFCTTFFIIELVISHSIYSILSLIHGLFSVIYLIIFNILVLGLKIYKIYNSFITS